MRVIAVGTLKAFWEKHAQAEQPLRAWHDEAKAAKWTTPQDIRDAYASAGFISNNRVVFNIKGNDYRLIVAIAYTVQIVYIKFIGTHAEYDDVDASNVEMV